MAAGAFITPRINRIPIVQYGPDGKLVVADSDGTFVSLDGNARTVPGAGPSTTARFNVEDGPVHRDGPPPTVHQESNDAYLMSESLRPGTELSSGGSPHYARRNAEPASEVLTINSANISTASSSLARRLRLHRSSRRASKRSASDVADKDRKHRRKAARGSKRHSSYAIDKPHRRKENDTDPTSGEDLDGNGTSSGEHQRITNVFWQEMIEESRRRRLSNSPGRPSQSNGKRIHSSSRSPAGSTTGSRGRGSSRSKASSRSRISTRSSRSNRSRFSRDAPRMSVEYAATLSRQQSETNQSTDLSYSLSLSRNVLVNGTNGGTSRSDIPYREEDRFLGSSCAVGTTLIVLGCLLVTVGVLRLLVSCWHEYGSSAWAGLMLLLFGFVHIVFGQQFTSPVKSAVYLVFGAVASLAVLAAIAVTLVVVVPTLGQVAQINSSYLQDIDSVVLLSVNFSQYPSGKSVAGLASATWTSVGLDLCSLVLLTLSLHAQTITTRAFDNYLNDALNDGIGDWPAASTSQRKSIFQPIYQTTIGQITIFLGFFEIIFMDYLPSPDPSTTQTHAWSTVWSGALLIIAGLVSMCYDKVVYSRNAGITSVVAQICSLVGCGATTVITTLVVAKDFVRLQSAKTTGVGVSDITAMTITAVLSDVMSVVGVVFTVALLIRYLTRVCDCKDDVDKSRDSRNGTVSSSGQQRRSSRVTMDNWQPRHATEMFDVGQGVIP